MGGVRTVLVAAVLIVGGCGADPGEGAGDAGEPDAVARDAAAPDAEAPDADMEDAGVPDAGTPDAVVPDAAVPDAAPPDAEVPDAAVPDAMPDVDECALDPCSPRAVCTDQVGSFTCTCRPGFTGDGFTCVDVDECAGAPCAPAQTCTNTPGAYACADPITDECAAGTDDCSPNATCTDTPGGFTCACTGGTIGDGTLCQRSYEWLGVGEGHGCALDGSALRCWGDNSYGQLGTATLPDAAAPEAVPDPWTQADVDYASTCGVGADGTWRCRGLLVAYLTVAQLGTETDWQQAAAGVYHTCAIKTDQTLWCAGWNGNGQLGNGNAASQTFVQPIQVGTASWVAVDLGTNHSCAIDTAGGLWCWGMNYWGQLGVGDNVDRHAPTRVGADTWLAVSVEATWTCGLRSDGEILCWGDNYDGQLGTGGITTDPLLTGEYLPVPIAEPGPFLDLDVGPSHTCALDGAGELWCWGESRYGSFLAEEVATYLVPVPVGAGGGWVDVEVSGYVTCARRADGTVHCWGVDTHGQLGGGDGGHRWTPTAVAPGTSWRAVDARGYHACAIRDDGTLWCWGSNSDGALGDGTRVPRDAPIQVGSATDWLRVATTIGHTCGIRAPDQLWCWGDGYGDAPVVVPGAWLAVSASTFQTCGLSVDRTLWCWPNGSAPAAVGLAGVESFQVGHIHACAIQAGGALWCWGQNYTGALGDGTYTDHTTPAPVATPGDYRAIGAEHGTTVAIDGDVLVGAGHRFSSPLVVDAGAGADWVSISSGNYHSCGLRGDGRISCTGTAADRGGGEHPGVWSRVSAAMGDFSCALDTAGELACWGETYSGGIGDGDAWRSTITPVVD